MAKILITGGAGYIGSHVAKVLYSKGFDVIIYDNLSTGYRKSVINGNLVVGDILDSTSLSKVFSNYKPDAVMHFAAKIVVPESVRYPIKYYTNNVLGTLNVLRTMKEHGVDKFIFSSSAAVYGEPKEIPVKETMSFAPINPYGKSKAMIEEVLKDCSISEGLKYIALRYFNVAGADPEGELGEIKNDASHLITMCVRTATGKRKKLSIFGTDYPTLDGTCVRDYIHIMDLSMAHILALEHLLSGGESDVFNCGYGKGYSVQEVVSEAKKVTGVDFAVEYTERRAGDPPELVANPTKIKQILGWKPKYNNLGFIIKTAWEWEKKRFS